jgi:hypothetical protein
VKSPASADPKGDDPTNGPVLDITRLRVNISGSMTAEPLARPLPPRAQTLSRGQAISSAAAALCRVAETRRRRLPTR